MDINKVNERDDRYVREWRDLSDEDKFRNLPALQTDYYINELICSMKDDLFKLFTYTAYATERPGLNQEVFATSVLCSLQSDALKKQYMDSLLEEHNRTAVLGSMKDILFMQEQLIELTDGADQHYVRERIKELQK